MSIFDFFRRPKPIPVIPRPQAPATQPAPSASGGVDTRRYFHNQQNFQCYTTWFAHWDGWISAGHCVTEAKDHLPSFVSGNAISWPDGLDAAIVNCTLPVIRPDNPVIGRDVIIHGYPAGSRTLEIRKARIYHERMRGQWIAHILEPDEPVVTGMSGGPVIDAATGVPLGITITRNSPADLNNDRDPDESADFIALSAVWDAIAQEKGTV